MAKRTRKKLKIREKVREERIAKIKTGVKGLDKLMRTGIPIGSSVLVEGGPGSGKTILCLQIAWNACKMGKKVLYMSFEEAERRLREHMRDFGWNPEKYEKSGQLKIIRVNALDVARSVEALLSEAKRELLIDIEPMLFPVDFKPDIVLVDSLTSIASAFSGERSRFRIYMEQFFKYLEKSDITSFLIKEVPTPTHVGVTYGREEAVSFLADGIIVLYNIIHEDGHRGSAMEIYKMRGEEIKRKIVRMDITSGKGIVIRPEEELKGGRYKFT